MRTRRKEKETNEMKKFKLLFSHEFAWGLKYNNDVYFSNHKIEIEKLYNKQLTNKKIRPRKIPNYMFADHLSKKTSLYYVNKLYCKEQKTSYNRDLLIMIDIDINKSQNQGTTNGAIAYANRLKREFGQKLYTEPSTSGHSVHGYIRINTERYKYDQIKEALDKFEGYLITLSKRYDIELVELKGHPFHAIKAPTGQIVVENMGQLAKVPYALADATSAKKLFNTKRITISEIMNGKYSVKEPLQIVKEVVAPRKQGTCINQPVLVGSHGTKLHFPVQYLDAMPRYAKAYVSLFGTDTGINRWYFAVATAIMLFVKNHRMEKDDGTYRETSIGLYKEIWDRLYKEDKVNRSFNQGVFCKLKTMLSNRGFIQWIDNKFVVGSTKTNGKATTWYISDHLDQLLNDLNIDWDDNYTDHYGPEEHKECIRTKKENVLHQDKPIL